LDDKSLEQSRKNVPADVRSAFHVDEIQALVVKYASEPFEIAVEFVEHNGLTHPVIVVPPGVRTPVAAKAGLKAEKDGKPIWLIGENDVYFRTMESSGVVASAKILWKDWRDLVEICFDNREADIGRFLRRHLAGVDPATLAVAMGANAPVQESIKDRLKALLADGLNRFKTDVHDRGIKLPPHGSWEVALIIDGELPSLKLDEFANHCMRAIQGTQAGRFGSIVDTSAMRKRVRTRWMAHGKRSLLILPLRCSRRSISCVKTRTGVSIFIGR
jgi:hypothetical protein